MKNKEIISRLEFESHDCHLGSEDGCTTCEIYAVQRQVAEVLWQMVSEPEKWEFARAMGTPVNTILADANALRKVALKCVELGYYSMDDYAKFCRKNGVLMF